MKITAVIILAIIGLVLLILAAAVAGGAVTMAGAAWLLPAGLAAWCTAWLVSVLPVP